jgi:hypothetical protein
MIKLPAVLQILKMFTWCLNPSQVTYFCTTQNKQITILTHKLYNKIEFDIAQ